jgi:hypothetical protein
MKTLKKNQAKKLFTFKIKLVFSFQSKVPEISGTKQLEDFKLRKKQISLLSKNIDPVTCECTMHVTCYEIK